MQEINIGLIGLGTVGMGVYTIIKDHQDDLRYKTGCKVIIKQVLVRDVSKPRDPSVNQLLLTDNYEAFFSDPELDIIVEVAGGVETAYTTIKNSLNKKKHIITANKDLMAIHGAELLNLAKENHCDLFYEASVGGGIPIIRSLSDGLASDKIKDVLGIINGTTNYILTKMDHENMTYEDALKKAQDLGFAESDPTSDVGGIDAARKMAILANLAFSMPIDLEDVRTKGIAGLNDSDLAFGKQLGYEMKLLGIAKIDQGAVEVSVGPTFIPHAHPLTSVHNEYNAVFVRGEAVGTTMFYGPGAGGLPTATSIVSDVVTVVKNMVLGTTGMTILAPQHLKSLKADTDILSKYYLRLEVKDQVGVFSSITALFANKGVSFEKIIQEPSKVDGLAEIIIVTHVISLLTLKDTLSSLEVIPSVTAVKSYYPIEQV